MSTVTLTGFSEIERARLRYALILDETLDFKTDPFIDVEMDLEISLCDLVVLLTDVRDALYEPTEVEPATTKPAELSSDGERPRKYVAWHEVIRRLVTGESNVFVHTMKASSAASTRATLLSKYPGLDVDTQTVDANLAVITVKIGSYKQGE